VRRNASMPKSGYHRFTDTLELRLSSLVFISGILQRCTRVVHPPEPSRLTERSVVLPSEVASLWCASTGTETP
jgi:hypothetical protein